MNSLLRLVAGLFLVIILGLWPLGTIVNLMILLL